MDRSLEAIFSIDENGLLSVDGVAIPAYLVEDGLVENDGECAVHTVTVTFFAGRLDVAPGVVKSEVTTAYHSAPRSAGRGERTYYDVVRSMSTNSDLLDAVDRAEKEERAGRLYPKK